MIPLETSGAENETTMTALEPRRQSKSYFSQKSTSYSVEIEKRPSTRLRSMDCKISKLFCPLLRILQNRSMHDNFNNDVDFPAHKILRNAISATQSCLFKSIIDQHRKFLEPGELVARRCPFIIVTSEESTACCTRNQLRISHERR